MDSLCGASSFAPIAVNALSAWLVWNVLCQLPPFSRPCCVQGAVAKECRMSRMATKSEIVLNTKAVVAMGVPVSSGSHPAATTAYDWQPV